MLEGRSEDVFKDWLADRLRAPRDGEEVVEVDEFTDFKTASPGEVLDAIPVKDPFHVAWLAGNGLHRC